MMPLPLCTRTIASTPDVEALLVANSPVAIGVSGGKDSSAVALATVAYLDSIGHTGPRILIHADLGATEWADSLPTCQRLTAHLGLELVVVRRSQGDMMDRWEQRWRDNVKRWEELSCVKLILPWSTPSMRFCTAELKIDQICRALSRRWPGCAILNVTGIRRAESAERAKAPVSASQKKLTSTTRKTTGLAWNPIIDWATPDVYAYLDEKAFPLHDAYTTYGASRVSCVYCILATQADHLAGSRDARNLDVARRMVDLEILSGFAFQGGRWLGDTLADALDGYRPRALELAKAGGRMRTEAECRIPKHLLYTKGWPTCVPTESEAALLAEVRRDVAQAVGLRRTFCHGWQVVERYSELLAQKARKGKQVSA